MMAEKQRIQLAPGVALVLEDVHLRGHTTAVLPPGLYSVEVDCHLLGVEVGGAYARGEAHFLIEVKGEESAQNG